MSAARALRWMLRAAGRCAVAGCSPRPWPTCFPEGDASVPHGAGETAALADARRRVDRKCGVPMDVDRRYRHSAAGVFESEFRR